MLYNQLISIKFLSIIKSFWTRTIKPFTTIINMFYCKLVGLFIVHFHPSIKFEGKPGTLSLEWSHVVGLTEVDPSLASKYQTRI